MRPLAVLTAVAVALPPVARAQSYVPPQPPCDIKAGFFRLNSVELDFKIALTKPDQHDRMLAQMLDVLVRSIRDDHQDKNPFAWYFLGRYYVERQDPAGADSAFARAEALAPQCAADINGYRQTVFITALNNGGGAWQNGHEDSAAMWFAVAHRLAPADPRPLLQLGQLYAGENAVDSAAKYLRAGAAAAGADTIYRAQRRDALLTTARLYLARADAAPAAGRVRDLVTRRDSLVPYLRNDSLVLDRIDASAASRRRRGARLAPADQREFTADSLRRVTSLARERALRDTILAALAAARPAADSAYAPAVTAYQDYLTVNPGAVDAALTLAGTFARLGESERVGSAFDAAAAHPEAADLNALVDAGQRLVAGNQPAAGARVLEIVLGRNPYHRDALVQLVQASAGAGDGTQALAAARRLAALDPLARGTLRALATAWKAAGQDDSAQGYARRAAAGLPLDVAVASFVPDAGGFTLTGVAANDLASPGKPATLEFEFLDAQGAVVTRGSASIGALPPQGTQQFSVHAAGTGIVGWRYHVR